MPGPRSRNPIEADADAGARADAEPDDEGDELGADDDEEGDEGDEDLGDDEGDDDEEGDDEEGDEGDPLAGSGALLGEPFAMSSDVSIVEAFAIVHHPDGKAFRINLLTDRMKISPHTQQRYTHALVICPEDDDQMVPDIVKQVIEANGENVPDLVRGAAAGAQQQPQQRRGGRGGGEIPEG